MAARTITFANVRLVDGTLHIGFQGSKRTISFSSRQHLRDRVRDALERDVEHQMFLAIAAFVRANPSFADPGGLNGLTFTADDGNG